MLNNNKRKVLFQIVGKTSSINCAKLSGAKLSSCQIVRFLIFGSELSWSRIVRFFLLVPNCPVLNCLVPNCPILCVTWVLPNSLLAVCRFFTLSMTSVHTKEEFEIKLRKTLFVPPWGSNLGATYGLKKKPSHRRPLVMDRSRPPHHRHAQSETLKKKALLFSIPLFFPVNEIPFDIHALECLKIPILQFFEHVELQNS